MRYRNTVARTKSIVAQWLCVLVVAACSSTDTGEQTANEDLVSQFEEILDIKQDVKRQVLEYSSLELEAKGLLIRQVASKQGRDSGVCIGVAEAKQQVEAARRKLDEAQVSAMSFEKKLEALIDQSIQFGEEFGYPEVKLSIASGKFGDTGNRLEDFDLSPAIKRALPRMAREFSLVDESMQETLLRTGCQGSDGGT